MQHTSRIQQKEVKRKLLAYSAAAGAVMAGGASEGSIIYSGLMDQAFGNYTAFNLTMEGDNAEIKMYGSGQLDPVGSFINFSATGIGDGAQVYGSGGGSFMERLATTAEVGDATNTPQATQGMFYFFYGAASMAFGNWAENGDTGFFGFSFELENESDSGLAAGSTVYGWGEVERLTANEGKLTGWAYENSGAPIRVGAVPEPHSLALLALGAAGVGALRRLRS